MWDNIKQIQSTDQNVKKFVFTCNNAVAETVLYKYPTYEDRTVICCSTMSGCPVGCRFCGAGDNYVRSLTSQEIVEQVTYLLSTTGVEPSSIKKLQIMFMSMGEPMLNWKNLKGAIFSLNDLYPHAKLLVSTSGPDVSYCDFVWTALVVDKVGLQFSVHESNDEDRNKLIPFKNKLTLSQIADTGERFFNVTGRKPFFNYCAHEGNTSDKNVDELLSLFDPSVWNATISVICERDENVAAANDRQRELATGFSQKLLNKGYDVRVFNPAGQDDIGGGCGQLWFVQDWMKNNPSFARPSVGRGKDIIHTPKQ